MIGVNIVVQLAQIHEDGAQVTRYQFADFGYGDATRAANQQGSVEMVFKVLNDFRNRRLGKTQGGRGLDQ
ncbi:hypothetical protein D3C72_2087480 [compost metagenome]